jgi:hypothetical protein
LSYELENGSPKGTAIPRRVLTQIDNLRSIAEFNARKLGRRLDVPPTHWNPELYYPSGKYLGRPDAWWDDVGLAWEIDSCEFHFYGADQARTYDRNNRYGAAGLIVVQTLPSRLLKEPDAVIAELKAAYAAAALRPRPGVLLAA